MNYQDKRILIVEDEPALARVLCEYFIQSGFKTHIIDNEWKLSIGLKTISPTC